MFKTELTNAEKQVYKAICENGIFKHDDLTKFLNVSDSTLRTHLNNIYHKLLVNSKVELVYQHFTEGKGV